MMQATAIVAAVQHVARLGSLWMLTRRMCALRAATHRKRTRSSSRSGRKQASKQAQAQDRGAGEVQEGLGTALPEAREVLGTAPVLTILGLQEPQEDQEAGEVQEGLGAALRPLLRLRGREVGQSVQYSEGQGPLRLEQIQADMREDLRALQG